MMATENRATRERFLTPIDRIVLSTVFLVALLALSAEGGAIGHTAYAAPFTPGRPASGSYSCVYNPAPTPNHCYGQVQWWNTSQVWTGAKMDMTIESMGCGENGCSDGHGFWVESALWLGDDSSWAQSNCYNGACWIEVGDRTFYDPYSGEKNIYVWADSRPCGGGYWWHYGGVTDNELGNTDHPSITLDTSSTYPSHNCNNRGTNWNVSITDPTYGTVLSGYSTNLPMQPLLVEAGMEVFGTTGESANNTIYWHINRYDSGQWNDLSQYSNGDGYEQQSPVHSWYTLPNPPYNDWYWDAYCAPSIAGGGTCTPY